MKGRQHTETAQTLSFSENPKATGIVISEILSWLTQTGLPSMTSLLTAS